MTAPLNVHGHKSMELDHAGTYVNTSKD